MQPLGRGSPAPFRRCVSFGSSLFARAGARGLRKARCGRMRRSIASHLKVSCRAFIQLLAYGQCPPCSAGSQTGASIRFLSCVREGVRGSQEIDRAKTRAGISARRMKLSFASLPGASRPPGCAACEKGAGSTGEGHGALHPFPSRSLCFAPPPPSNSPFATCSVLDPI